MIEYEFHDALENAIPEASPLFGKTIRETIAAIAEGEAAAAPARPAPNKRRVLTIVLAAVLLLAAAAAAATLLRRNVFDVTMGDIPDNATSLTRYDLAKETVGDVEITVREAAYDGMSLYIAYSIRDLSATAPYGAVDEAGENRLTEADYEKIYGLDVGWWSDNLWIDGKSIGMPQMSGGEELPGEQNGEALYYMQYRLDQENVYLDGKDVEIALPIGQRQPLDSLVVTEDPFSIAKPDRGMVTFHLDCSDRSRIATEAPNVLTEGPRWSAKVAQVVHSPIQMYVTLDWEVAPEVLEAYIEENGDGYYLDGVKLWDYDGLEICGGEIMSMQLVDAEGKRVFESMRGYYGCGGASATQAWYTFPYADQYPREMFLAPEGENGIDMSQAIRVR